MIIGVAIRSDKLIIMLPKPNRHANCFAYAKEIGINIKESKIGMRGEHQGFYTHTGRYLNREQASKYVKRVKQETVDGPISRYLFSEDVW